MARLWWTRMRPLCACAMIVFAFGVAAGARAQALRASGDPLAPPVFADPRLTPGTAVLPFEAVRPSLTSDLADGWQAFALGAGGPWTAYVDPATGRIGVAEGAGIPLAISGSDSLESAARAFLPRVAALLGADPAELKLNPGRSGQPAEHLWLADFDVIRGGLPIEGARVVLRVNHGNLVQFGSEALPSPGVPVPARLVGREAALAALGKRAGLTAADSFSDGGSLHLLPVQTAAGRGLVQVWQFTFERRRVLGTWRARVDATTGEVLEILDVNRYAQVTGGVYPESYALGGETEMPMPWADVASAGFSDGAGWYPWSGVPTSTQLDGRYVRISDACGPLYQTSGGTGRIELGSSAGDDCITPGHGGLGNTHAARTQFYHLNRIKEAARGWFPDNAWLGQRLTARVNLGGSCNAFWNGGWVSFLQSGSGCGNTGEVAAIGLHEFGHGLDQHDGSGDSPDLGTAEAYADFTAALMLRDSCIGPGFWQTGGNCGGYGDACTSCSGVRDIDWGRHALATPHTAGNFIQTHCPSGFGYDGPCGREGHCESMVVSEALWDFAARDLPGAGTNAAWAVAERLWYLSRPSATAAFACHNQTSPWTSDGCNTGSLWRTLRAVDDDDGNLANGTPHSCHLFAAFDRHGLACATDPGANVCSAACTPPPAPELAAAAGERRVELSWAGSGTGIPPGMVYDVYRSEAGCGAGFVRAASGLAGLSYQDPEVANGRTYSYQVIARPAGDGGSCASAPSACRAATPSSGPCTPPAAPAGLSASPAGIGRAELTWDGVPGATDYRILRATQAGGPYTLAGTTVAPDTSWIDTRLEDNVIHFYVVKAADDDCESPPSSEASVTTLGCVTTTLYATDLEGGSGLADWRKGSFNGAPASDWRGIQQCPAHSGDRVFRFGGAACTEDANYLENQFTFAEPATATGIAVPAGAGRTRLSFWHRWAFEQDFDGGTLTLSADGSAYTGVPIAAVLAGGYNGIAQRGCAPAGAGGAPIFTGTHDDFQETVVDLDAACDIATGSGAGGEGCAGRSLRIGFAAISDCIGTDLGWSLDDVTVTACLPLECPGPPRFAGLAAVSAPSAPVCRLDLSWPAAISPCGGAVTYDVFRSASPDFVPSAVNRIASGLTGTSYGDAAAPDRESFYIVRAVDAASGQSDGNTVRRGAHPSGPGSRVATIVETFDGPDRFDLPGWSHAALSGPGDWNWSGLRSQGGAYSWFSGNQFTAGDRVLVSPAFGARAATRLRFWHTWYFGVPSEPCGDASTLEISADGGASWSVLPDAAFLAGGFNGTVAPGANPLAGKRAWCWGMFDAMTEAVVDLSAWAGSEVRVRWHAGDDATNSVGWYVDSVTIEDALEGGVCEAAPPAALGFYAVPPCRLLDTRDAVEKLGPAPSPESRADAGADRPLRHSGHGPHAVRQRHAHPAGVRRPPDAAPGRHAAGAVRLDPLPAGPHSGRRHPAPALGGERGGRCPQSLGGHRAPDPGRQRLLSVTLFHRYLHSAIQWALPTEESIVRRRSLPVAVAVSILALLPAGGFAQIAPQGNDDPLSALAFVDDRLRPAVAIQPYDEAEATVAPEVQEDWQAFLGDAPGSWKGYIDKRNGRIESAEGAGIPWLPGRGNSMAAAKADLRGLEAVARAFASKMARALGVDPRTLALNPGRSGQPADHLWLVDFDVYRDGLAVEGARVVFRVNHGNLVQFGAENLPPVHAAVPPEKVSREKALAILAEYLGGFSAADRFVDGGSVRLVTTDSGEGRGLARVWQFVFKRKGTPAPGRPASTRPRATCWSCGTSTTTPR